jgi:hypothetical protein
LGEPGVVAEDDAYRLLAYLITGAEIGVVEPAFYGPRRLLDAAARLAAAMAGQVRTEQRDWLDAFARDATEAMALARRRPDEFEAFLHEAARGLATELKRRAEPATDGAGAAAEAARS